MRLTILDPNYSNRIDMELARVPMLFQNTDGKFGCAYFDIGFLFYS